MICRRGGVGACGGALPYPSPPLPMPLFTGRSLSRRTDVARDDAVSLGKDRSYCQCGDQTSTTATVTVGTNSENRNDSLQRLDRSRAGTTRRRMH